MSQNRTDIKLRRSVHDYEDLMDQPLNFGEPFFIDDTEGKPVTDFYDGGDSYLVLGRKSTEANDTVTVGNSPVIKCMSKEKYDSMLFKGPNGEILGPDGAELSATKLEVSAITESSLSPTDETKYYVLFQPSNNKSVKKFDLRRSGIYATGNGVLHGAAWNDYAENRKIVGPAKPGQVVCDFEDGVVLSSERLQPCPNVVSDTYGYVLGSDKGIHVPLAVAGRVLVYVREKDVKVGDCVCADKDGFASVMTRQEIINYPDRILGVVSEIPHYDTWEDKVPVDGRIWIRLR